MIGPSPSIRLRNSSVVKSKMDVGRPSMARVQKEKGLQGLSSRQLRGRPELPLDVPAHTRVLHSNTVTYPVQSLPVALHFSWRALSVIRKYVPKLPCIIHQR